MEVRINASVISLRSLDINSGTTLQILMINHKVLKVQMTNESHIVYVGLIPRIDLTPSELSSQFTMKRRQFRVRLCFKMTINKVRGQSMNNLGAYLPKPVFSHR